MILDEEDYFEIQDEIYLKYFNNAEEFYKCGLYYFDNYKDYTSAIVRFRNAIELKPDYIDAYYYKAICQLTIDKFEKAYETINQAIELCPDDGMLWDIKGLILKNLDKTEDLGECFEKACELSPDKIPVWIDKGVYYFHEKMIDESLKCFDKAIELAGDDNVGPLLFKTNVYLNNDDIDNAEKCLKKVENITGNNLHYLYEMAKYYTLKEDYEKALKYCDEGIRKDKSIPDYWMIKTIIYEELGQNKKYNESYSKFNELGKEKLEKSELIKPYYKR